MRPAVFLDRDDTLIENRTLCPPPLHPGDLCDPARVRPIPGAPEACSLLHQAGFALIVVSNQGLVARGHGTIADVEATNTRMVELFESHLHSCHRGRFDLGAPGARQHDKPTQRREYDKHQHEHDSASPPRHPPLFTAIYACPYHPQGTVPPYNREHPWRKPAPGMILHAAATHGINLTRSWMIGDSQRDIDAALAAGIPPPRCLRIGEGQQFPDLLAAARHILAAT